MTPNTLPDTDRQRWIALYVLCTGMLMIVLDGTVVNVALPTIQDDLDFSNASLAWVVNAYMIAFGGLLLFAGRMGDLIGRRRMFLSGLGLFTGASLLCGLSTTQEMLVGARFLQGVGGAMTSAVILGMIVTMFPQPSDQAKAIGVFAFVASAGGSIGLLLGGILTQAISWHFIFFINIPIGVVTALMASRLLEHDDGIGLDKGADVPGALLITSALMVGVYTIVAPAAEHGWTDPTTLLFAIASQALLGAFIVREHFAATPLIPLRIFKSRNVVGANLIQIFAVAGMFGLFFLGALYLQRVLGYDALETGLAFLPMTIVMGTLSVKFAEPLIMRYGARTLQFPGLAIIALSLAWFTQSPVDGNYFVHVMPVMILLGLGAGICFPGLMTIAMSGATPEDAGLASALVNTSAQVGGAIGLAVLATLSASRTETLRDEGVARAQALVDGYHLAFWIAVGLVLCAIAVAAFVVKPVEMPDHADAPDAEPVGVEA
ncbi:MAG: MFS transporter [Solirubrobacteraceae bacterium]|nr:MFS transporter [Solirubrobacteraceae bacterium]